MSKQLVTPLLFFFCLLLSACGSSPRTKAPVEDGTSYNIPEKTDSKDIVTDEHIVQPGKESLKDKLYSQHQEWQGTKYRFGGLSKDGIDCSGFVYLTFMELFDIKLPRSTSQQVKLGKQISKDLLETGDLVFFKTGRGVRHVGIYLENRQFMHASRSKGVMISDLENVYWRSKYWQSRRVSLEKLAINP